MLRFTNRRSGLDPKSPTQTCQSIKLADYTATFSVCRASSKIHFWKPLPLIFKILPSVRQLQSVYTEVPTDYVSAIYFWLARRYIRTPGSIFHGCQIKSQLANQSFFLFQAYAHNNKNECIISNTHRLTHAIPDHLFMFTRQWPPGSNSKVESIIAGKYCYPRARLFPLWDVSRHS